MKSSNEFSLLIKLYNCPTKKKGLFNKEDVAWCKKDFEKYLGYSDKNKEIRTWLNLLIELGCIEMVGKNSKGFGHTVPVYVTNKKKIGELIKSNGEFDAYFKYFYDKYFMIET